MNQRGSNRTKSPSEIVSCGSSSQVLCDVTLRSCPFFQASRLCKPPSFPSFREQRCGRLSCCRTGSCVTSMGWPMKWLLLSLSHQTHHRFPPKGVRRDNMRGLIGRPTSTEPLIPSVRYTARRARPDVDKNYPPYSTCMFSVAGGALG